MQYIRLGNSGLQVSASVPGHHEHGHPGLETVDLR